MNESNNNISKLVKSIWSLARELSQVRRFNCLNSGYLEILETEDRASDLIEEVALTAGMSEADLTALLKCDVAALQESENFECLVAVFAKLAHYRDKRNAKKKSLVDGSNPLKRALGTRCGL
jgi:hypothetical protein